MKYLSMGPTRTLAIRCESSKIYWNFIATTMNPDPRECNIKVVSRFRPQSGAEIRAGGQNIVSIQSSDTCVHGVSLRCSLTIIIGVLIRIMPDLAASESFVVALYVLGTDLYVWSRFQANYDARKSLHGGSTGHCSRQVVYFFSHDSCCLGAIESSSWDPDWI